MTKFPIITIVTSLYHLCHHHFVTEGTKVLARKVNVAQSYPNKATNKLVHTIGEIFV